MKENDIVSYQRLKKIVRGFSPEEVFIYIRTYDGWGNPEIYPAKFVDLVTEIQFDKASCRLILEANLDL